MLRSVSAVGAALVPILALSACGAARHRFVPPSRTHDAAAQATLALLQRRINTRDTGGLCALYAAPARACMSVWQRRLRAWPTPARLEMTSLVLGCAGDARMYVVETSRRGRRRFTLSLVDRGDGRYTRIIDIARGGRLSSLQIPRYGSCGDPVGWAGSENRDRASQPVEGNGA
jgi:hypothetical protein